MRWCLYVPFEWRCITYCLVFEAVSQSSSRTMACALIRNRAVKLKLKLKSFYTLVLASPCLSSYLPCSLLHLFVLSRPPSISPQLLSINSLLYLSLISILFIVILSLNAMISHRIQLWFPHKNILWFYLSCIWWMYARCVPYTHICWLRVYVCLAPVNGR